ncbi:MAG: hypothetical protein AB9882_01980 [Ignavibacteriaceae bacterium]
MDKYPQNLYMIVFPINALVASQLNPHQFAEHYTVGSAKHYRGKVIFAEIDIKFRDAYFEIDNYLAQTVPHENGQPKKTKFISSYAVLEHMDLKAIKNLFLVTPNGKALKIKPTKYTARNEPGMVRVYQEIAPLTNLVASTLDQRSFGKFITTGTKSKGCPKLFFTQYELNVTEFLKHNQNRDLLHSPIPDSNPRRLFEFLLELKENPEKKTKTISLSSTLLEASYLLIRHGFWFAYGEEMVFFPMPTLKQLENEYYDWWKFIR